MADDGNAADMRAADALRAIDERQAAVERPQTRVDAFMLGLWGLAYLVGFGVLALDPAAVAGFNWRVLVFGVSLAIGIVGSIAAGMVRGRGVRGRSNRVGAMIGVTWLAAFVAAGSLFRVLGDSDLASAMIFQLCAAISILIVGGLYMMMGAFLQETVLFAIGVWFLVIDVVGLAVGHPDYLWINALLGGGAMLVAGIGSLLAAGRPRRG